MSETEIDTEQTEYRLRDDVDRVVRAGLVLEAGETIALQPGEATAHDDVLEPVDGGNEDDVDAESEPA